MIVPSIFLVKKSCKSRNSSSIMFSFIRKHTRFD